MCSDPAPELDEKVDEDHDHDGDELDYMNRDGDCCTSRLHPNQVRPGLWHGL